jgi:hypothetical protein
MEHPLLQIYLVLTHQPTIPSPTPPALISTSTVPKDKERERNPPNHLQIVHSVVSRPIELSVIVLQPRERAALTSVGVDVAVTGTIQWKCCFGGAVIIVIVIVAWALVVVGLVVGVAITIIVVAGTTTAAGVVMGIWAGLLVLLALIGHYCESVWVKSCEWEYANVK